MTALPTTTTGGPRTTFSPEEAEHYYGPLGALKGPLSARGEGGSVRLLAVIR